MPISCLMVDGTAADKYSVHLLVWINGSLQYVVCSTRRDALKVVTVTFSMSSEILIVDSIWRIEIFFLKITSVEIIETAIQGDLLLKEGAIETNIALVSDSTNQAGQNGDTEMDGEVMKMMKIILGLTAESHQGTSREVSHVIEIKRGTTELHHIENTTIDIVLHIEINTPIMMIWSIADLEVEVGQGLLEVGQDHRNIRRAGAYETGTKLRVKAVTQKH